MKRNFICLVLIFCVSYVPYAQDFHLDSYGGCSDKPLDDGEDSGFFRTKYDGEQWWLLSPDNNAFLAFGLNHFHSGYWAQEWNKVHWQTEFGGIAFSETWRDGLYAYAHELTGSIHANSFGYHNEDNTLLDRPKVIPYIRQFKPLALSNHLRPGPQDFADIFAPEFVQTCADAAREQVLPYVNDSMIIGFGMADIPVLTQGHAKSVSSYISDYDPPTWPRVLRNLPATSHGKLRYVETMKDLYDDLIADFNSVYETSFISWKELESAEDWRPDTDYDNAREMSDNNEFGKLCINKYYEVATHAFRAVNTNHLFLGDKLQANLYDQDELTLVIQETSKYTDLIFFQCFGMPEFQESVHQTIVSVADMPIFNGDGGFGAYGDPKMPNPQYPTAKDQAERAHWFLDYAEMAFSHPNYVGYHICGAIDGWNTTGKQKPGIVNPLGVKHQEVIDSLTQIGNKLYAYKGITPAPDPGEGLQDWGKYEPVKDEAIERIEQFRKGDAHLRIILPDQEVAADMTVSVKLKRHDFKWGAVLRESFGTSPYSDVYKENFLKYFNGAGFGIEMKPKWRGTTNEANAFNLVMPWLLENDIYVRGHALAWEGYDNIRPEDQAIYDDASLTDQEKGEKLLESCGIHFSHAIPKWDVKCWDVSNEPMTRNLINDLLPDYNTHVHWFKLADSIRRESGKEDLKLYLNDYQVISAIMPWALNYTKPGYNAVGRPALYREMLDEQIALGAPIDAIGFQSRLKSGLITPDSIYKRLCDFERFDLPYHATEFEIRDDASKYVYTDSERRLLTEYMMVMYLSHPKVEGFWHWTFAEVRDNMAWDYALFNYDGTPKISGRIWMDLMDGFFSTDLMVTSDDHGEVNLRGYYGSYEVIVEVGDSVYAGSFAIDSTNTDSIIVVNLDRGYRLSGLEDGAAYELDQAIPIEISAFSNSGDITSIGLFLNSDSIGGSIDSTFTMEYTPTRAVEGWNEFKIRLFDDQGNSFSHSIDVYFGDTLPILEILNQPEDTIYSGTTGNQIVFKVLETYGTIELIRVIYADQDILYADTSGTFAFNMDDLPTGDYQFSVEVIDHLGGKVRDTVLFTVILPENILPSIEILSPADSSVLYIGSENTLTVEASDSDGGISTVDIYLNNSLSHTFTESPYSIALDTLRVGEYNIIAMATDDRKGQAADTIYISVQDNTSASGLDPHESGIVIFPNPVSNTFHFNMKCDYEIYTLQGRKILEGKEAIKVDVSTLIEGLYLVKTVHGVSTVSKAYNLVP